MNTSITRLRKDEACTFVENVMQYILGSKNDRNLNYGEDKLDANFRY